MKTITSLLLAGVLFSNCSSLQAADNRAVSPFTKIENSGPLDIVLEKGTKESVTVEVTGTDPQKVLTDVTDNILKIHMESGNYSNLKGKVTITYVNLSEITNRGSGDLIS
jgi:hypothetical protein